LSENQNSFLRPLKNKGFKEERVTKIGLYAIGKSTTLESNKSLAINGRTSCRPWRHTAMPWTALIKRPYRSGSKTPSSVMSSLP
jgi:hypothetical protein